MDQRVLPTWWSLPSVSITRSQASASQEPYRSHSTLRRWPLGVVRGTCSPLAIFSPAGPGTLLNSSPPTHSVPSSTPEPPAINPECCSLSPRFPGIKQQALFSLTPACLSVDQTVGPHPPSLTNSFLASKTMVFPASPLDPVTSLHTPDLCSWPAPLWAFPEGPSLASSSLAPPLPSSMQSAFSVRWRTHMTPSPAQTLPLTCLVLSTGKLPQF